MIINTRKVPTHFISGLSYPDSMQISNKLRKGKALNIGKFQAIKHVIFQKVTGDEVPLIAIIGITEKDGLRVKIK